MCGRKYAKANPAFISRIRIQGAFTPTSLMLFLRFPIYEKRTLITCVIRLYNNVHEFFAQALLVSALRECQGQHPQCLCHPHLSAACTLVTS